MWRLPMMFWLIAALFFFAASRRRRWRRWAMMEPMGYARGPWAWDGFPARSQAPTPAVAPRADGDAALVEVLESRIAGLEQRLDFAERLLAGRKESPAGTPEART